MRYQVFIIKWPYIYTYNLLSRISSALRISATNTLQLGSTSSIYTYHIKYIPRIPQNVNSFFLDRFSPLMSVFSAIYLFISSSTQLIHFFVGFALHLLPSGSQSVTTLGILASFILLRWPDHINAFLSSICTMCLIVLFRTFHPGSLALSSPIFHFCYSTLFCCLMFNGQHFWSV